jgi:hypothetical protein
LLRRFFEVFLFEDIPAADRRPDEVYFDEVDRCSVYVGLLGNEYGSEGADGISPTEREFDRATSAGKKRLVFIKGPDDGARKPKMLKLVDKACSQLIRRRFGSVPELLAEVYASLVEYLEQEGLLRTAPFDGAVCRGATIADLSKAKLDEFLGRAQARRAYSVGPGTPMIDALAHLNLLDEGNPSHAAVLLFGNDPQRWMVTSGINCLHFHGTEVLKPIPSYQVYGGTAFALIDQAVDFVMSKIDRAVGTRAESNQAQATAQARATGTTQDKALSAELLWKVAEALGIPTAQATAQAAKVLSAADAEPGKTRDELQTAADIAHREHFRKAYLEPLVAAGWLERTLPDKPTSPNQKYRLTAKGRAWLELGSAHR